MVLDAGKHGAEVRGVAAGEVALCGQLCAPVGVPDEAGRNLRRESTKNGPKCVLKGCATLYISFLCLSSLL